MHRGHVHILFKADGIKFAELDINQYDKGVTMNM